MPTRLSLKSARFLTIGTSWFASSCFQMAVRSGIAFVIGYLAFLYFGSEVLLAVAVQLAFSYTASNAAVKIAKGGWLGSVWRITWKPMLGSLLCAVALGFMFDTFVPNANTMVDVVRVLTS